MAQLPRVAVLGGGRTAGVTVSALVDSGLPAHLFIGDRIHPVDVHPDGLRADGLHPDAAGRRPFDIQDNERQVTRWDVVVLTDDLDDLVPGSPAMSSSLFGGVFDPETEGVYRCGRLPRPGAAPAGPVAVADAVRLADAQSRWIGEYLRGRYLLPSRSAMLAAAGLRPTRRTATGSASWPRPRSETLHARWLRAPGQTAVRGYLRWLGAELRRGRARAAEGGYPLPVPSLIAAS